VDPVSLSAVDTKRFADAKPPTVSGAFRELGRPNIERHFAVKRLAGPDRPRNLEYYRF